MAYIKSVYKDYPDQTTLIDAEHLNNSENGIENNDIRLTTVENIIETLSCDWSNIPANLTYAQADSPDFTMLTSDDTTGYLTPGMKMRLKQQQALTGYWTFDTNSSPSVGSYSITNIGTPTYTTGRFGNSLTLNGTNQALEITDTASLKPSGEFTIGCWIKTTTNARHLFQSQSTNPTFAGFVFRLSPTGAMEAYIGNNAGGVGGFVAQTNVCDNQWHYVVLTFNNNFMQIYVDGKLDGSGYSVAPVYAATNYVRIGANNNDGTNTSFFNGQIDDLFLINGYALDEFTIWQKYLTITAQGVADITIDKKFFIISIANNNITVYGGTDYALTTGTITDAYFSTNKAPYGFPTNPDKWSIFSNGNVSSINNPTNGVYYNIGGNIVLKVGLWKLSYDIMGYNDASAVQFLSFSPGWGTSTNNQNIPKSNGWLFSNNTILIDAVQNEIIYNATNNTTLYLNACTNYANTLKLQTWNYGARRKAVCAYL